MVFVRGVDQADFVSRLRGVSGDRVLLIPVDVGKRSAMSMVANQLGEMLVDPFEFPLDRGGVDVLLDQVAGVEAEAEAVVVRFGAFRYSPRSFLILCTILGPSSLLLPCIGNWLVRPPRLMVR